MVRIESSVRPVAEPARAEPAHERDRDRHAEQRVQSARPDLEQRRRPPPAGRSSGRRHRRAILGRRPGRPRVHSDAGIVSSPIGSLGAVIAPLSRRLTIGPAPARWRRGRLVASPRLARIQHHSRHPDVQPRGSVAAQLPQRARARGRPGDRRRDRRRAGRHSGGACRIRAMSACASSGTVIGRVRRRRARPDGRPAQGEWIVMLDDDCSVPPEFARILLDARDRCRRGDRRGAVGAPVSRRGSR